MFCVREQRSIECVGRPIPAGGISGWRHLRAIDGSQRLGFKDLIERAVRLGFQLFKVIFAFAANFFPRTVDKYIWDNFLARMMLTLRTGNELGVW
jgi:hypothetical protein